MQVRHPAEHAAVLGSTRRTVRTLRHEMVLVVQVIVILLLTIPHQCAATSIEIIQRSGSKSMHILFFCFVRVRWA